jgi:WD40 repeat protein
MLRSMICAGRSGIAVTMFAALFACNMAGLRADPDSSKEDDKGPKELQTIDVKDVSGWLLTISPDNKMIFLGSGQTIQAWDIASGKRKYSIELPIQAMSTYPFARPIISPDGKTMLFSGGYVVDLENREVKTVVPLPKRKVDPDTGETSGPPGIAYIAAGAGGKHLASWSGDGEITIWDVETGKAGASFKPYTTAANILALSPDAKIVATARDGKPKLWDVATGKEKAELAFDRDPVRILGIQFTANGKAVYLLETNRVTIWRASDGKRLANLEHDAFGAGNTVAVFPDGDRVALAPERAKLNIVDAASGNEVVHYHWISWPRADVIVSPDGSLIASARESRIRIWPVGKEGKGSKEEEKGR